ncbi:leucine-rich repeat domain-containing protein [Isachenkonia alkalipeptolytica]|uniref:Leucine-rich repeat domain-containing protein n=1 Tax=Isachenkonia alkalipeptolytica TaxID=2565777 RepID=A0AA43XNB0_9CLOT|nr:leucine-rich repeat domain-containing protein [Isachenkonia alkalipeptolytica]NBG89334.1 leucine-rich repeat domain-containing protein [Isachenkonia alkalipeptolytica]
MLKKTIIAILVLLSLPVFTVGCSDSGIEAGEVVSYRSDDTLHVFIEGSGAQVLPEMDEEPEEYLEEYLDFTWDDGNSQGIIRDFAYDGPQNGLLSEHGITEVHIHEGVQEIGAFAFFNNELEELTLSEGVEVIGSRAFRENQLTTLTLPDSVTTIDSRAFRANELEELELGTGVTHIKDLAFDNNQLNRLTVPDNVTTMENGAFGNNELTEVTLGSGITDIQPATFWGSALTSITIGDDVTIHDDEHTKTDYMMGTNQGFKAFYEEQGKEEGTYTWTGEAWER